MPQIKGTALIPAVKLVRKNREKMESMMDHATRAFVDQRFFPGTWYPMEDASRLLTTVCRFFGGSLTDAMELVGRLCAEEDLRGVYAHVIQPGDPTRTIHRATVLWHSYVDTGTLRVIKVEPGEKRSIVRLEGFPRTDVPYCACILGMAKVIARLLGMTETLKMEQILCTLRGDPFCEFHSSWE